MCAYESSKGREPWKCVQLMQSKHYEKLILQFEMTTIIVEEQVQQKIMFFRHDGKSNYDEKTKHLLGQILGHKYCLPEDREKRKTEEENRPNKGHLENKSSEEIGT